MGKSIKEKIKEEINSFKEFAVKGDAITLAVGVVIGVAFKDLVDALVNNVFTPPIGFLTAKLDFSKLFITIGKEHYDTLEEALAENAVVIQYGLVLNALITFTITAVILYFIVRSIKRATEREEKKVAKTTKTCPFCKTDIPIKAKRCPNCTSTLK